jgi:uncharacterized damage-inducible protein DinB
MSLTISLDELLDYSDHERAKWRDWIAARPDRLRIPLQPGGRFPTVGSLLDHVFLVERRHLARLEGGTPPATTGLPAGDAQALFEYGELVRADLRRYAADANSREGATSLTFSVQSGDTFTMTRRKLAFHIVMHEIRHLAQVALAARLAGDEPPGTHDFIYYPEK